MNSTQCPELSFYTGRRGCWMISYTPYHMIYTRIRLAIMWKGNWFSLAESFEINYVMTLFEFEFLLATRVYRSTINLFRVRLMAICNENHPNTMVNIYRYKWKPPHDTLFGEPSRLTKFEANRCKIEGDVSIEVILGMHFPCNQPQHSELPNKGTQRGLAP